MFSLQIFGIIFACCLVKKLKEWQERQRTSYWRWRKMRLWETSFFLNQSVPDWASLSDLSLLLTSMFLVRRRQNWLATRMVQCRKGFTMRSICFESLMSDFSTGLWKNTSSQSYWKAFFFCFCTCSLRTSIETIYLWVWSIVLVKIPNKIYSMKNPVIIHMYLCTQYCTCVPSTISLYVDVF